jgi:hypothetical protein
MASVVEQLYKLNPTVNFFKVIIYTSSVLFSKEPNTQSFTQKMHVHQSSSPTPILLIIFATLAGFS